MCDEGLTIEERAFMATYEAQILHRFRDIERYVYLRKKLTND